MLRYKGKYHKPTIKLYKEKIKDIEEDIRAYKDILYNFEDDHEKTVFILHQIKRHHERLNHYKNKLIQELENNNKPIGESK